MPKIRSTARKPKTGKTKPRTRKTAKHTYLGLYLLGALAALWLVYWLATSTPSQAPDTGKQAKHPVKETSSKAKKTAEQTDTLKQAEEATKAVPDLENGLKTALTRLDVFNSTTIKKKKRNTALYQVPINPSVMDLTFANMIIKGELDKRGGQYINCLEKKSRQYLTYFEPGIDKTFEIELFYQKAEKDKAIARKAICIIVDDFGNIQGDLLQGFAQVNSNVCFAVMPDLPFTTQTLQVARARGHDCLIHVPMEPKDYPKSNPGEDAIFLEMNPAEITRRMEKFIADMPQCQGVNNHMGSLATADETTMRIIMKVLRKHGLYFVDSRTSASSVAGELAQKEMVPFFHRDIFLDEPKPNFAELNNKLNECDSLAAGKRCVIAIMHCHSKANLELLQKFISGIKARGFELVSLSTLGTQQLPEIR